MNKIITALLIGILLTTSLVAVKSAYASSLDSNPHENLSKDKKINQSHHVDFNKHKVAKQKAYGYSHSKVCGLELCPNAKNDTPSYSFLQGHGSAGGIPSWVHMGDGHIYLKGYYQYQNTTNTHSNSTK
jgi:hypothetical protein